MRLSKLGTPTFIGQNLRRPECVLATRSGHLFASDWEGGVTVIDAAGAQQRLLARNASFQPCPNGIALLKDGSFLLCHLGAETGGVFRLQPNGLLEPYLTQIDEQPLPPTNYAHLDSSGRVWVTVSTRLTPRASAYRGDIADGFIAVDDKNGTRIVADGLGYTNECLVHPDGRRLFVNETFARRLSSFDILPNGDLSNRRTITEFGPGTFPDGMAFDAEGGVWITSIVSNRLIRVTENGEQTLLLEDADDEHVSRVEQAFLEGKLGRSHLDTMQSETLRSVSSVAFGGPDLKTLYLGCLLGDQIVVLHSPIAGHPPPHWAYAAPRLLT